jgi:hypothetical protein
VKIWGKRFLGTAVALVNRGLQSSANGSVRDICAVTLSRFTGEKGVDISSQNIFLDDSQTRHLTILGTKYRKNSSEPVFSQ